MLFTKHVVIIEVMLHACVPSFMSIYGTLGKFRGVKKENFPRPFVVGYKHCCRLQTLLLDTLCIQPFIHKALTIHTNTCVPIIMYCLGLFVVVYSKKHCLQHISMTLQIQF